MTNIEYRSLFQLLQNLSPRDAEGLGKRRPEASLLHTVQSATVSRLRNFLRKPCIIAQQEQRRAGTRGYHAALSFNPTNCTLQHASKRDIFFDLCLLGACLLVTSVSLVAKNGHVHRITMHGHLTCPERFWHVSDTRIGTILNPTLMAYFLSPNYVDESLNKLLSPEPGPGPNHLTS